MVEKGIDDAIKAGREITISTQDEAIQEVKELADKHNLFSALNSNYRDEKTSYPKHAANFLYNSHYVKDGEVLLKCYKDSFHAFKNGCYNKVSDNQIKSDITKWAISTFHHMAKSNFEKEVFNILRRSLMVPDEIKYGDWFSSPKFKADYFTCCENGIICVKSSKISLIDHSPDFFSITKLPVEYNSESSCPKFEKFLNRVQPEEGSKNLIQEWLGYNLFFDTSREKFLINVGEGANGKSVFLQIMKSLVGEKNFSCVLLEAFNPQRLFNLASTDGKLANIIEELDEFGKGSEGLLKSFVSGQGIDVEKKHKDPYTMRPTARITINTNVLPPLTDRSNGIWRRLLLVEWPVNIPKEEQNPLMLMEKYWKDELSGILNWALAGLARLNENGMFTVPDSMTENVEQFKRDRNPAIAFLQDDCVFEEKARTSDQELFNHYLGYCERNNQKPLSKANFGKEVQRYFPRVSKSKNAHKTKVGRFRVWEGIRLIKD